MKKLIISLCLFVICQKAQSQSSSIESEAQFTLKNIETEHEFYMFSRYDRFIKHNPKFGYYVEIVTDANTSGVGSGFLYKFEVFKNAQIKTGLGLELEKEVRGKEYGLVVGNGIEFSTKEDEERARWKLSFVNELKYSKEGWWHMSRILVSPFRWLSVGLQDQTNSLHFGGIMQINFPGNMKLILGADGKQMFFGLKFSGLLK